MQCIAGYLPVNDVTARDIHKLDVQFTRSKGGWNVSAISGFRGMGLWGSG
jgi:2-keto-4-pentenoate hydratase/2-oxohepta-3-ene-1,7-dioic acid hydratase in catechol pathway